MRSLGGLCHRRFASAEYRYRIAACRQLPGQYAPETFEFFENDGMSHFVCF
jgi:hypothetical protein